MFAVFIKKSTLIQNPILNICEHRSYLLRISIVEMQLLDSECDTEIGSSKSSSKGHRLVTIYMRTNFNRIEKLFQNLANQRNSAVASNNLHSLQILFFNLSFIKSLLKMSLKLTKERWLLQHLSFHIDIQVNSINQPFNIDIGLFICWQGLFEISTFMK